MFCLLSKTGKDQELSFGHGKFAIYVSLSIWSLGVRTGPQIVEPIVRVVVTQLLSHVRLFAIPWVASLSSTISWSLLELMSIESVILSLTHPLSPPFPLSWWLRESACNAGDQGRSLGPEDPLKKRMTTHSSMLAWEIPWTEEPAGLMTE